MNESDLAREVVSLLAPEEMVYGSYVRDQISHKNNFTEMSVFLPCSKGEEDKAYNNFIKRLQDRFGSYSTTVGVAAKVTEGATPFLKKRVKLQNRNGEVVIEIDLVTNESNDPFVNAVSDIETVAIKNGRLVVGNGLSLAEVKNNIKNKVCKPHNLESWDNDLVVSTLQVNKLLSEGYTMITENKTTTEDNVLVIKNTKETKTDSNQNQRTDQVVKAQVNFKKDINSVQADDSDSSNKINMIYKSFPVEKGDGILMPEKDMGLNMNTLKLEATEAAYRMAAAQMVKVAKAALVKGLKDKKSKKGHVQGMSDLLDSELGTISIKLALGYALQYIPMIKDDPRAIRLGKEFRVSGMAAAGNLVFDELLGVLTPILTEGLKNLPPVPITETLKEPSAPVEDLVMQTVNSSSASI